MTALPGRSSVPGDPGSDVDRVGQTVATWWATPAAVHAVGAVRRAANSRTSSFPRSATLHCPNSAVHGTVNDLAMRGARPLYLTAGFILEAGLSVEALGRVVHSMAASARLAGVQIVAGDRACATD